MKLPHVMPRAPLAQAAWASRHPMERRHVVRSLALSVAIHALGAALVCLAAYWFDAKLKELLNKSDSIAESGPAPEQSMTVNLVIAEPHPPPAPMPKPASIPTPETLPVLPPIQLKMVSPAPATSPTIVAASTKPVANPGKKPAAKPKPKFTAVHAAGEGRTPNISPARVGASGLPAPGYPAEALALHEGGTVGMDVLFGPDGRVTNAKVQQSSGFSILDVSTRTFIYAHWKNASLANATIHVPITYDPSNRPADEFHD